ncbi:hypothetical protein MNBD_GAMMA16-1701 [hydrothermal vent metagenome]|uniref:Peptidase A2 domain-containing protein n=1 Tax=hydrothermal vent metagenome TaxID=652676 RepID=A0A3B0ZWT1_9ZZZZ
MNKGLIVSVFFVGIATGWLLRGNGDLLSLQTPSTLMPIQANGTTGNVNTNVALASPPPHAAAPKEKIEESPNNQNLNELKNLLRMSKYDAVIAWLTVQEQAGVDVEGLRQIIMAHARTRVQQKNVVSAIRLLELLINHLPQAFDERIQLAALYQQEQQFYAQLTTLFNALAVTTSNLQVTQLDHLIEQAVKFAKANIGETDINANIKLYEFLIHQRAAHTSYYIELSALLIKASRLDAAIMQLNVVQHDPFVGDVAQQMLIEIERLKLLTLETPVALERKGNHFIVDAMLNDYELRLMIDTGASLTVLSNSVARALGLHESNALQRLLVNTANGSTEALLYRLETMTIGEFNVSSIDIAVVANLEINGASGLLGMNFLQNFEFRIDQKNEQLFLKYRE